MENMDAAYFIEHFNEALDKGYIRAYFQPIYRSMTGKMMCAESLARWIDPERGMISPALFISALEDSGMIFDLDMEILRQACQLYRELRDRGTLLHSFSVNLSRQDFWHADLYLQVVGILDSYEVPHDAIKLEITENIMMEDEELFRDVLEKFDHAGFKMWMDDFGSGYSSLNVLKNYKFDLMKFDMLFLQDFSARGRQLLASLINMAKSLGIHTLTEGIEMEEQQDFLRAAGCETLQGFYYAKPLSKEAFVALIDAEPELLEPSGDKRYWRRIGQLNFLSASPLEEYVDLESGGGTAESPFEDTGAPIALLECAQNRISYVYASQNYMKNIRELGYESLSDLENDFNNHRSDQYLMMKKLVTDAISKETIQLVEYINNDVYYRLSAKCLAKKQDHAMLAFYLSTFDSDREVQTAKEMLNYGNALFSTYEVVVLLYPESGIANRIYTANNLPIYDRESSLTMSVKRFTEAEVASVDQERYMRFMDFSTLFTRVKESPKGFVQGFFRMRWSGDEKNWHAVRFSRVPSSEEKTYLLTIQMIQGTGIDILDMISREHPEMLE